MIQMPMPDRAKWAERQIAVLIDMGDDAMDAEKFVNDALATVPEGEDPETYVEPPELAMQRAEITAEDVADARAEWYADEAIPQRYKRLLDAKEKEGKG